MLLLHCRTGLEASLGSTCSGQQQHAQELQQLAQSHQGLQQQLLALGNHVDPAAAAQLAAAMNGDESALSFQPLGDTQQLRLSLDLLAGPDGGEDSWLTGCYMQAGATSAHGGAGASSTGTQQQQQPESSGGALAAFAAAMQRVQQQQGGAGGVPRSSAGASRMAPSHGSGGGGARMGAVLRHLPVAVRLQRLEAAVRELCGDAASKATDGRSARRRGSAGWHAGCPSPHDSEHYTLNPLSAWLALLPTARNCRRASGAGWAARAAVGAPACAVGHM